MAGSSSQRGSLSPFASSGGGGVAPGAAGEPASGIRALRRATPVQRSLITERHSFDAGTPGVDAWTS